MRNEARIEAIPFKCIPPKYLDVSSMDYCVFKLLKRALFKRHPKTLDEHSKIVKKMRNKINLEILFYLGSQDAM